MLQQLGLRMEHIAGAVTDAGTDIKGALGKAFKWEWCLPHLLNRVTVDATQVQEPTVQRTDRLSKEGGGAFQ